MAREIEAESFTGMQETEILDILLPSVRTYFNPEELEEMANHVPENVQEEMVPSFNAKSISRIINHIQDAVEEAMNLDPIMARSLLLRQRWEFAVQEYEELFKDNLRRAKQSKLTDYFKK